MAIQKGDKLKTISEFRDLVIEQLGHYDPFLQNAAYDHQSKVHLMVEMMSKILFDQQMMYHQFVLEMGAPQGYGVDRSMPVDKECQHEYVDKVLFNSTYRACKHCDMDKPKSMVNVDFSGKTKPPGIY